MFWLQITLTAVFFIPFQTKKMLGNTDGLLVTSFLLVAIYCGFILALAINGRLKEKRDLGYVSRTTNQMVIIWFLGVSLYVIFTVVFLFRAKILWNWNDWINSASASIGIIGAWFLITKRGLPIDHPDVKMYGALAFRIIPGLMLGLNIVAAQSGKGLSPEFIWCFHYLICLRMIQNFYAMKLHGSDRNRRCIFYAEFMSVLSWWWVTTAWLIY